MVLFDKTVISFLPLLHHLAFVFPRLQEFVGVFVVLCREAALREDFDTNIVKPALRLLTCTLPWQQLRPCRSFRILFERAVVATLEYT